MNSGSAPLAGHGSSHPYAPVPIHWQGIDARKGDLIDRLAAALQRARLWKRRERKRLADARASGDEAAIHAARVRYRRAAHWRAVFYRTYVRAVWDVYA